MIYQDTDPNFLLFDSKNIFVLNSLSWGTSVLILYSSNLQSVNYFSQELKHS